MRSSKITKKCVCIWWYMFIQTFALPCILLICKWTQIYCSVFLHHFYNANKYLVIHVFLTFLQVQKFQITVAISNKNFWNLDNQCKRILLADVYIHIHVSVCDGRPTCYYRHWCHSYSSCDLVLESCGQTRRVCREGEAPHSEVVVIGWDLGPWIYIM